MGKGRNFVALVALVALAAPGSAFAADRHVSISGVSFQPRTALALPEDTVIWTNNDSQPHNVTFSDALKSPDLTRGARFSHTFTATGTFPYRCTLHIGMNGSVVVRDVHLTGPAAPVLFGRQATFTGLARAFSTVELHHASAGKVAETTAAADGRFSVGVAARAPGHYHAVSGTATSTAVRLAVRARVAIKGRRLAGRLVVSVSTTPAQRRATVVLERRKGSSWARIARTRLNTRSQATFRVSAPRTKVAVRARLVGGVGGYTANASRAVRL